MAEMVPVTITGVVRGAEDGPARGERFFIELAAAADEARRLLIGVGDAEAAALAFSLQGQEFPRPMTYQLMAALVAAAGSAVRSVRVTGLRDGIFYAQVLLRGGVAVDARPSDALNLAAIAGAPVYVADELLGVPAGVRGGGVGFQARDANATRVRCGPGTVTPPAASAAIRHRKLLACIIGCPWHPYMGAKDTQSSKRDASRLHAVTVPRGHAGT